MINISIEKTDWRKFLSRKQLKCYSYTNNLYKIISNHNKNLIEKSCVDRQVLGKPLCNCWVREECPVGDKCDSDTKIYFWILLEIGSSDFIAIGILFLTFPDETKQPFLNGSGDWRIGI